MGKAADSASTFAEVTQEILQIILESHNDEIPVFDAILKNACRLCDATRAALFMVNGDRTHAELKHLIGYENRHAVTTDRWPLDSGYVQTDAIKSETVFHVADIRETDLYRNGDAFTVKLVDEAGMRTSLAVPMFLHGWAIGSIIAMRHDKPRPFTLEEIQLVEAFAAQAVIAIENSRQFREVESRLEREAATREILEVISGSRADEKPVFDVILKNASRLCKAPLGFLSVLNEERTHVIIPAQLGVRPEFESLLGQYLEPLEGSPLVANRVISEGEVILSDEIGADPRYPANHVRRSNLIDVEGAKSLVGVPLFSGEQAIGGIVLYRREVAPFDDEDVGLVQSFAAQAAIAIENARQFKALQARTEEVQALYDNLESKVDEQVGELERMGRLKRFLPAAVADVVVTAGDEELLASHRALIATLFCDLRGFTAFCEAAEPEETIDVLQTYHHEMSTLIDEHGGGVDQRAGDGIMVIFNDPIACDDPAGNAVRLAIAMRAKMQSLCAQWKKLGHRLGFGVGISLGYATVGMVGSAGRFDYTASGTSVNTAARLCDLAKNDEILLSPRAWAAVEYDFMAQSQGEVEMKGIREPVEVFALAQE